MGNMLDYKHRWRVGEVQVLGLDCSYHLELVSSSPEALRRQDVPCTFQHLRICHEIQLSVAICIDLL